MNMKRIKSFEAFINEDATAGAGTGTPSSEDEKKDFEHLPRLKTIVDKDFFGELKQHVFYWFNYDFLKKKYAMVSLEADENEVTVWFSDNVTLPLYQYKVTFNTIETNPIVDKVEEVRMLIWIYDYESQDLLKHTEMKIGLKYINSESFNKFVNKVKKRIIRTPKDGEDVQAFKKKEKRRLGDNIY